MAFDDKTRARLQKFVSEAREKLTEEFTAQLQNEYGLDPVSGNIVALEELADDPRKDTASVLRHTYDHYLASTPAAKATEILDRIVREQAFTVLNRLVALRMCEERGLLVESIARGATSQGFQLYEKLGGAALGERAQAYRAYILSVFDEFATDLGIVFDRFAPSGVLFPGAQALDDVLALINHPDLEPLWSGDETIGWIYQYFNTQEERQKMRKESAAPRNSRELAVRNQFFTPRYVVEFLVDNTLGRTWIEMMNGETRLTDRCRFFVKPMEDDEPRSPRAKKDPRDLKILDPACGSGHFLLYAFDLLVDIYEEAWNDPDAPPSKETGIALRDAYETARQLQQEVPGLVLRHNLHGVDIDPRAAQIAQLALWMRAQRVLNDDAVPRRERPLIKRTNIIVAEPMPGQRAMKEELLASLDPKLARVIASVFDRMHLAGDLGILLPIEHELRDAMREAYKDFGILFEREEAEKWNDVEARLFTALSEYADNADGESAYSRRLFVDDAKRGISLIDVCRERYDVVLMNPPFGEPAVSTGEVLSQWYGRAGADIDAAFVDRGTDLLVPSGLLGGIFNRTQFFKGYLSDWRDRLLLVGRHLHSCIDLGFGVLDGAMVEAVAYTTGPKRASAKSVFVSALSALDKERAVNKAFSVGLDSDQKTVRWHDIDTFLKLPEHRIAYWVDLSLVRAFADYPSLEGEFAHARQGLITADNERFLRLWWEVSATRISRRWFPYAKGGDYSPYFGDVHLLANWYEDGAEIKALERGGRLASRPQNISFYFKRAITYTERTASDFSPRAMPDGCIFDCKGPIVGAKDTSELPGLLALLNSRVAKYYVELAMAAGDSSVSGSAARQYTQSIVGKIPVPLQFRAVSSDLGQIADSVWRRLASLDGADETSRFYAGPTPMQADASVSRAASEAFLFRDRVKQAVIEETWSVEKTVRQIYQLDADAVEQVSQVCGPHPIEYSGSSFFALAESEQVRLLAASSDSLVSEFSDSDELSRAVTKMSYVADRQIEILAAHFEVSPIRLIARRAEISAVPPSAAQALASDYLSYCVGTAFGRFDLRLAMDAREIPSLPDPFDPLPICSPGMLTGEDGLPLAAPPADYPIRWPEDGLLVDDRGHPRDLAARVAEVLRVVFIERAEATEREICATLGAKSLDDWLSRPAKFFNDHLARYSKSRRQAPMYWPLSTESGAYTIWVYIHRLTDQTLFLAVNDLVEPKLRETTEAVRRLRAKATARTRADEIELEELTTLETELGSFRNELLRVAEVWKPDLDDGVVITASPLWKLFRLPKWQKTLKETWQKLERGEYDWAHLAYAIRPNEVREKCKSDKSLAISHGLEELYVEPPVDAKKKGRKAKVVEVNEGLEFE